MKSTWFVEVAQNGKIGGVEAIQSELKINPGFTQHKIESKKGYVTLKGKILEQELREGKNLHQGKYEITKI